MKAKNTVKVNPPARGILKSESPAIQEARRQRAWGRFNRLTIGDILEQLRQMQDTSESQSCIREVRLGLFDIIETARGTLLSLTGAPGIIGQGELEAAYRDVETRSQGIRKVVPEPVFFPRVRDLVLRYRAGWLVEAGDFRLTPSGNELICVRKEKSNGQAHSFSRRHADLAPSLPRIETPSPTQLQAWFDLPSEPRS